MAKILHLDIEVSPTLATVWGLFKQNISINQITGNSEVLTWSAMWHGSDEVMYATLADFSKRDMLVLLYDLINEADAVVTYNGDGFDLKILNKEFLELGLPPPSSYKSVDLLKVVKKHFRFTSNKLDYVSQKLGLGKKVEHRGHQLWLDCMAGKRSAFAEMAEYNVQDVVLLEKLYNKLQGWIHNGPNLSVLYNDVVCPNCGGHHFQSRGYHLTQSGKYRRFQCKGCGTWTRSTKSEPLVKDRLVKIK